MNDTLHETTAPGALLAGSTQSAPRPVRYYLFEDLRGLGIPFHIIHLSRLEKAGEFPKRYRLASNTTSAWRVDEIEAWLASRTVAIPKPRIGGRQKAVDAKAKRKRA